MKKLFAKKRQKPRNYELHDETLKMPTVTSANRAFVRERLILDQLKHFEFGNPFTQFAINAPSDKVFLNQWRHLEPQSISLLSTSCPAAVEIVASMAGKKLDLLLFNEFYVLPDYSSQVSEAMLQLENINYLEYSRTTFFDKSAYDHIKHWSRINVSAIKLVAVKFNQIKLSSFGQVFIKSEYITTISLFQAPLDHLTAACFYRSLEYSQSLAKLSLFKSSGLATNESNIILVQALLKRNKGIDYYQAVGAFDDVGAYCLAKLLQTSLLTSISLRQSKTGPVGLCFISAALMRQSICKKLSVRFLSRISKEDRAWNKLSVALTYITGLRHFRCTQRWLTPAISLATERRSDFVTDICKN